MPPREITFAPELPISARVSDITAAVCAHPVVIVAGATGSGKTTQLPKIVRAMGRGEHQRIGVTQPRRIAATSVAARVAQELNGTVGAEVGYQIRFEDRTARHTAIKFMTDGVLLAEIQSDPLLRRYDTIILDEAHERSLTIDFLLGWMQRILPRRADLKVIVSSATLENERFSAFFGRAPIIEVEGRTFPVDVLYAPPAEDLDLADAVADAVADVTDMDPHGDILVFLPGEREIRDTESALGARTLRNTTVQPLYARLSAAEQSRVFAPIAQRRVILATNVAETSLTLPGIVYVIDTGIARLSRYDARSGVTRLQIEAISRASAEQRKGRCGRVREGVCVRLYDEESFNARPAFTDPEIKRTGLAGVILRMKSLDLGDVETFAFLDPPQPRAISEGYRVLEELGALTHDRVLTPLGGRLARFPVDPRIARMILAGAERGCLDDVLVIAAALNLQDPRERPRERAQRADELHRRFRDERSDFAGLLKLWDFVREAERKGSAHLRRTCRENFLSYLRVREWRELHRQLDEVVRTLKLPVVTPAVKTPTKEGDEAPHDRALHTALLTGLLSKIGQWNAAHRIYQGARETRFMVHPSSSLSKRAAPWVMAFELVETTQLYARMVARIEPEWILDAAPHLVKRSHSDPHWSEKSARAVVREAATLYGVQLYRDRTVDYASVSEAQARLMFIDHALVRGEYKSKGRFQARNREVMERVATLRNKARRSNMIVDDEALLNFFDQRVPSNVVNGKLFEAWREIAEAKNPDVLTLSVDDVLANDSDLRPAEYPDVLTLHGVALPLTYRFDPAADDDGATVTVPLVLVPQIREGELDWAIPAWHRERLAAVLLSVPKAVRRRLGTLSELADTLAAQLKPFDGPLRSTLAKAVGAISGVTVDERDLDVNAGVAFLRLYLRIVDEQGKVIAEGRNIQELLERHGARARAAWKETTTPPAWERRALSTWNFGDLAPFVLRRVGTIDVRTYPALIDRGSTVDLTLLESSPAAVTATRGGVRRLVMLATRGVVQTVLARIPPPLPHLDGSPTSRDEASSFRSAVLARIVDDAFALGDASLPRSQAHFEQVVREGTPRLDAVSRRWADTLKAVASELDRTLQAMRAASKHPSGSAALKEMRAQLDAMAPAALVETATLMRLAHLPRYLKAMQVRLARAVDDPPKDAGKYAPFGVLWATFVAKRAKAADEDAVEDLRWMFEELRVSIFAPELTTPISVSTQKVSAALASLR
jgi:ATP-dependent helicase HrpA